MSASLPTEGSRRQWLRYAQMVYAVKLPGNPNPELNDSFSAGERQLVDRSNALAQLPSLTKG